MSNTENWAELSGGVSWKYISDNANRSNNGGTN